MLEVMKNRSKICRGRWDGRQRSLVEADESRDGSRK